jgi:hypothetical protein
MRSIVPLIFLAFAVAACSADVIRQSNLFSDNKSKGRHDNDFVTLLERGRTLLADTSYAQTKVTGDAKHGDDFGTSVAMSGDARMLLSCQQKFRSSPSKCD